MTEIADLQGLITLALSVVLFGVKAFALIDCIGRSASTFSYLDTLSKQAWLIILGLAVAAHLVSWYPLGLLNLAGTVAALVYLAQVRGSSR